MNFLLKTKLNLSLVQVTCSINKQEKQLVHLIKALR